MKIADLHKVFQASTLHGIEAKSNVVSKSAQYVVTREVLSECAFCAIWLQRLLFAHTKYIIGFPQSLEIMENHPKKFHVWNKKCHKHVTNAPKGIGLA